MRTEPCMCGGILVARPEDVAAVVETHNRSLLHLEWRYRHDPPRHRPTADETPVDLCRGTSVRPPMAWSGVQ